MVMLYRSITPKRRKLTMKSKLFRCIVWRFRRARTLYFLLVFTLFGMCVLYSLNEDRLEVEDERKRVQTGQVCIHPRLMTNHSSVVKFFHVENKLQCSSENDWVFVRNGTFRISAVAKRKHGKIMCEYVAIHRGNTDYDIIEGKHVKPMPDNTPLQTDYFKVACVSQDKKRYYNVHSGISFNASLHARLRSIPRPINAMGYNVLMYGYDSVSRMTWYRMLPRSQAYFTDVLKGFVLEGYNIVGDGTPQALLPILTGRNETELPEARKGITGATSVDGHPWIWKNYSSAGYVTQWVEDMAGVGTFQYRMLGFNQKPTDHSLRPFYLVAEKIYPHFKPFCLGSTLRHVNMLNWLKDLYNMYTDIPKFTFGFHSEYSHVDNNKLQHADENLLAFLKDLHRSGRLDNTILILMSDHGSRFHNVRQSEQGKLEERMPYFAFRFPSDFEQKYPLAVRNFRKNRYRLTTPYDIHETLHDIINYKPMRTGDVRDRGISLFAEIPPERDCSHAHIQPHWCACVSWTNINSSDDKAIDSVSASVTLINSLLVRFSNDCAILTLYEINQASRYSVNDHLLRFKQSRDKDGRLADMSDTMQAAEVLYQVTFVTSPGGGKFETTVRFNGRTSEYSVSHRDISRINKYGTAPWCIMDTFPHLRPYCYCKQQLTTQGTI